MAHVLVLASTSIYARIDVKQTGSRKVNPTLCIVVIVPGSVAITYRNSIQSNIIDISHVYNITWIYLLHNPKVCVTNLRVQVTWAKRKQTESGNDI